jgi:serine/threonine protein phosphatase PrpC
MKIPLLRRASYPSKPRTEKDPPVSWAASQTGPREQNEDDYGRADQDTHGYNWVNRGCLYLLADGMGGLDAGKEAAKTAVRGVVHEYRSAGRSQDIEQNLVQALQSTNQQLYNAGAKKGKRMGSTLVACVLKDGTATIAHAGDSRAYHLAEGELHRCTQDHLYATEVLGIPDDDQAKQSPEGHKITRALGKDPDLRVDTKQVNYSPGDRFLLCSDGISEVLAPEEIRECLLQPTPEKAVHELCSLTEKRLRDNATAVVVFASGNKIRRRKTMKRVVSYAAVVVLLGVVSMGSYKGWQLLQERGTQNLAQNSQVSANSDGKDKGNNTTGNQKQAGSEANPPNNQLNGQPAKENAEKPLKKDKPSPARVDRQKPGNLDREPATRGNPAKGGKTEQGNAPVVSTDSKASTASSGQVQSTTTGHPGSENVTVIAANSGAVTTTPSAQTPKTIQHPSGPLTITNKTNKVISLWSSRGGRFLDNLSPGQSWPLTTPLKNICWQYADSIIDAPELQCPAISENGLQITGHD